MGDGVDPKEFSYALQQVKDGYIFENFAQAFLGGFLGYVFVPVGSSKDRGIDGLEHTFHRERHETIVYQCSTEENAAEKVRATIVKLRENGVKFNQLVYVTSRKISTKDRLVDDIFESLTVNLRIYDGPWFSTNINHSGATVNAYKTHILSHLHQFEKPGRSLTWRAYWQWSRSRPRSTARAVRRFPQLSSRCPRPTARPHWRCCRLREPRRVFVQLRRFPYAEEPLPKP